MNKRYVKWLYQELPVWVNKGMITSQHEDQIKQYYGPISEGGKKRTLLILCSVLGALLIGLGIVSLIAHNWEQLNRPIRVVLSFAPLIIGIALTGWALLKENSSDGFREGASTFLTLMIGASIALISQTYNISGDFRNFTLTWMLLAIPLVYLATVTLPGLIYVIGITAWSLGYVWTKAAISLWYWPLIAVLIPHFLYAIRQEKFAVRALLLATFLAISFPVVALNMLIRMFPQYWTVVNPLVFAVLYLVGTHRFRSTPVNWQQPFYKIGGIGVVIVSLILTYRWPWSQSRWGYGHEYESGYYAAFGYIIILLLLAAALFLNYVSVKERRFNQTMLGIAPIIALIGYGMRPLAMVLCNIYFLALSLDRILSGIRLNHLRMVNSGLLLLAVLIAVRFFDSEINLILKGLVLIALGAGFLATNVILLRRKGVSNE